MSAFAMQIFGIPKRGKQRGGLPNLFERFTADIAGRNRQITARKHLAGV